MLSQVLDLGGGGVARDAAGLGKTLCEALGGVVEVAGLDVSSAAFDNRPLADPHLIDQFGRISALLTRDEKSYTVARVQAGQG